MLAGRILAEGERPLVVALTFDDLARDPEKNAWLTGLGAQAVVPADNLTGRGSAQLREGLMALADRVRPEPGMLDNLVRENELVLLVTPIDLAAPKGRLILPQVEAIREILDRDCAALVVKERELSRFYPLLRERPTLVVTDSQAFSKVAADIPEDQRLTSFSILLARKKGDIRAYLAGIEAIDKLPEDAEITRHRILLPPSPGRGSGDGQDPAPFQAARAAGGELLLLARNAERRGTAPYSLVITCGNCMRTRREVLSQLERLGEAGVPVTNYGVFLAWANGLLPRAVELFPELAELEAAR